MTGIRYHDNVIKWKYFPRYWPYVRGIPRSPVNSPHKGQWRGALMFSLICAGTNDWVNNRGASDLRRYRAWWRHGNVSRLHTSQTREITMTVATSCQDAGSKFSRSLMLALGVSETLLWAGGWILGGWDTICAVRKCLSFEIESDWRSHWL